MNDFNVHDFMCGCNVYKQLCISWTDFLKYIYSPICMYLSDLVCRASIGVTFTILVLVMFSVAGKAVSDIGRMASPEKYKMAAMISEQFVQLQLNIVQKLTNTIFRLV